MTILLCALSGVNKPIELFIVKFKGILVITILEVAKCDKLRIFRNRV